MAVNKNNLLDQELKLWKERLEQGLVTQVMYEQQVQRLLDGSSATSATSAPYNPSKDTLVELMKGMVIGSDNHRFCLDSEIGGGAMGRVWKVHDLAKEELDGGTHYKAIKVVAPELLNAKRALENLKREAMRASELSHPNAINVNGWHQGQDRSLFIEMEYLDGSDLDHLLFEEGEDGLPIEQVLLLLEQMANALEYAHQEHNLVHRDLKPGNVFITTSGRIKLLDFGLAYQLRQSRSSVVNAASAGSPGTPIYMPPEAFVASKPDPRQDVYALACLTYELLTGEAPYGEEAARNRLPDLYPPKPEGISEQAWNALKQSLTYNREDRPASAKVFYHRFRAGINDASVKAEPQVGDGWREPIIGMEFVWIPSGEFMMGSPKTESGYRDELGPQHKVCLPGFWMGKFAVTQKQWWQLLMGENSSEFKGDDLCPVENISWDDAQHFLEKLSSKTGELFRLPSEAEWEYAARAGTTGPFSFEGKIIVAKANYNSGYSYDDSPKSEYRKKTVQVGSLPANPWGLYEMHGNVWE